MHGLDVASLGAAICFFGKVDGAAEWQNPYHLGFENTIEQLVPAHYAWLSHGATRPLVSSDARELNDRLSPHESGGYFVNLQGRYGVVSLLTIEVPLPQHSGRFSVHRGGGSQSPFFMVPAPQAKIYDVRDHNGPRQVSLIDTDDGGQLWLTPSSYHGSDSSMLDMIRKTMTEVTRQCLVQGGRLGGVAGVNQRWKAVAFPSVTSAFWRHVEWMDDAHLETGQGTVGIDGVFQRITVNFDGSQTVRTAQPGSGGLSRTQVVMLDQQFTMFKTLPDPDRRFAPRLEWTVQIDKSDWDHVS